jgi:hypothetical protein
MAHSIEFRFTPLSDKIQLKQDMSDPVTKLIASYTDIMTYEESLHGSISSMFFNDLQHQLDKEYKGQYEIYINATATMKNMLKIHQTTKMAQSY